MSMRFESCTKLNYKNTKRNTYGSFKELCSTKNYTSINYHTYLYVTTSNKCLYHTSLITVFSILVDR